MVLQDSASNGTEAMEASPLVSVNNSHLAVPVSSPVTGTRFASIACATTF
jgi:hypothetical protein